MSVSVAVGKCVECTGAIVDLGDELVCGSCGIVTAKEVLDSVRAERAPQAIDYTAHSLGGYLGPLEPGYHEKFSRGFSASSSTFQYLKLVSDFAGREDGAVYACAKMIERVCEKLSVPRVVLGQATVTAKKLLETKRERNDITTAAVSAYAIISACKTEGVTSVGVREIVEAHRLMGRRVKTSALIQLSLESPVRTSARRAEEYVSRVVSRLESVEGLSEQLTGLGMGGIPYFNRLREAAKDTLGKVDPTARGGHSPCTLAATAVYAAEVVLSRRESRKRLLSQRDVAESVNVAEYTVREQFGEIFRPLLQQQAAVTERTPPTPPPPA
ncbi:MAG TPA: hypothetical protein VLY21_01015 [Nitrososphaerales archaeon]|nr:hypothetical protein [Nitrososphaerales archaeon]